MIPASQVAHSVGVMLFALRLGRDNICPIGRGIPCGNHGCLPVSHRGTHDRLGCISGLSEFLTTLEKLCMGPGPPMLTTKFTLNWGYVSKG